MADGRGEAVEAPEVVLENEIINVIVHSLNKVDGGFIVDDRKKVLEVGVAVQRLIDQLAKIYSGKTGKSHGRFEDDVDNYPISRFLETYYKTGTSDFVTTTFQMAENLKKSAQGTASTGGHVFFAHFKKVADQTHYFIVAILNDELGAALNKSKEVVDALHLDIKGFRLAGRINLTSWADGADKYLSFIKGRGQDKVSEFFKLFLGCNNSIAAVVETQKLGTVLEAFAQSKEMTEEQREDFLKNAYTVCKRYADKDTPFELEAFANELWPDNPEELSSSFEESGLDISDGFIPDKRSLRSLVKFSGGTKNWRISFDRAALSNDEIEFNVESETLVIKNLPEELLARLRVEVSQDGEED
ncbi:nucleoid-associated protein [Pseudomonas chlororaphis]|uniref:nucleoid-associated protein n=1 Tax=Pseudomonas chlororaphis TaxID=587753 RepID=UPI00209A768A|nr:nucleoid-associated protein [Pseudomonas chlororaphis]MCO7573369.1 nucleoid-associated protein [Pseudomonas chlororaphis]MCO7591237.1 nucleoid-associated protein [Pseudomonas chlororaphis]